MRKKLIATMLFCTLIFGNIIYWIGSPEAETEHQSIYRKCLVNRGHSVLN